MTSSNSIRKGWLWCTSFLLQSHQCDSTSPSLLLTKLASENCKNGNCSVHHHSSHTELCMSWQIFQELRSPGRHTVVRAASPLPWNGENVTYATCWRMFILMYLSLRSNDFQYGIISTAIYLYQMSKLCRMSELNKQCILDSKVMKLISDTETVCLCVSYGGDAYDL